MEQEKQNETRVYVVAKSVNMTDRPDDDKKVIWKIPFGTAVTVLRRSGVKNGKVEATMRINKKAGKGFTKQSITGWVPVAGLTADKIEDFSNLIYFNWLDKPIPVTNRYKSQKIIGHIQPGERVEVIAKVGHWGLTEKGWTKGRWLKRSREIFDERAAHTVMLGVLAWSVTDYRKYVRILRDKRYIDQSSRKNTRRNFVDVYGEITKIKNWFASEYYLSFFDSIPGNERLHQLDEELGVNDKWWKEQDRIFEKIGIKLRND